MLITVFVFALVYYLGKGKEGENEMGPEASKSSEIGLLSGLLDHGLFCCVPWAWFGALRQMIKLRAMGGQLRINIGLLLGLLGHNLLLLCLFNKTWGPKGLLPGLVGHNVCFVLVVFLLLFYSLVTMTMSKKRTARNGAPDVGFAWKSAYSRDSLVF